LDNIGSNRNAEPPMRIVFGLLGLLIVLAIVGTVGKKQFEAIGGVSTRVRTLVPQAEPPGGTRDSSIVSVPGGMPGATPAPVVDATVPMQARQIQDNFRDATNRALQQGAQRAARSDP
jgi:hypothetical protein